MSHESGPPSSDPEEPFNDAAGAGKGGADAGRTSPPKQFPSGQWQPPSVDEVATLFPALEVQAQIGRGGMGAVYRARHPVLNRLIAIKLMPIEISADATFAERFVREAQVMALFTHPNIVAVYDIDRTLDGHLYFTMECVDGSDLHKLIYGSGVAPQAALEMVAAACNALAYAHHEGVVHRDVKPANIMVDSLGQVKMTDFGLARRTGPGIDDSGHTVPGLIMGTPDYMAPEQMKGMNVDLRADIYSLGVVLYETLCKQVPKGSFEMPSIRIGCDKRIDDVVNKAMQPQPERRYQTASEMKAEIDEILETMRPPEAKRSSRFQQAKAAKTKRRRRWIGGTSAAVLLLGGALVGMQFWPSSEALPPVGSLGVTPAPEPELPKRALVKKLLKLGAVVKSQNEIKTEADIPEGDFPLKTVDFVRRSSRGGWTEEEYKIVDQLGLVEEVIFRDGGTTDSTLVRLRHCENASTIQLFDLPKVTGAGLEALRQLPRLERLSLTRIKVSDAVLTNVLVGLDVTQLELIDLPIGDEAIKTVATLKKLTTLHLKGLHKMTVAGWAALAATPKLHKLEVADQPFEPPVVEAVAGIKDLDTLTLENTTNASADLLPLTSLPKLKTLELGKSTVEGPLFDRWPKDQKLQSLILPKSRNLDLETVKNIVRCFPRLGRLSGGAQGLEEAVDELAGLKQLTKLQLTTPITEDLRQKLRKALPRTTIEAEIRP